MKFNTFARFFSKLGLRRSDRKPQRATRRSSPRLSLERLEDRTLMAVLAAPIVTNPNTLAGGFDPQIARDPLNSQNVVEVNATVGGGLTGNYSTDGGQTWTAFPLPANVLDPTSFSSPQALYSQATSPSVAFDRNENFYVVSNQYNAAGTSGAIVFDKFQLNGVLGSVATTTPGTNPSPGNPGSDAIQTLTITAAPNGSSFSLSFNGQTTDPIAYTSNLGGPNGLTARIQAALDALPVNGGATGNASDFLVTNTTPIGPPNQFPKTFTIEFQNGLGDSVQPTMQFVSAPSAINNQSNQVLYQWGPDANGSQDIAYNPVVAIDTNLATFTDPDTNATQTDTMAVTNHTVTIGSTTSGPFPKAIYVAWNTNLSQATGSFQANPTSSIMTLASEDGGKTFTTQQYISNPFLQAAAPQIFFTQGTASSSANTVPGGQMNVVWNNLGGGVVIDQSKPDGGVATADVATTATFTNNTRTNIADAGPGSPNVSVTTRSQSTLRPP
jgi:hypothetical protein